MSSIQPINTRLLRPSAARKAVLSKRKTGLDLTKWKVVGTRGSIQYGTTATANPNNTIEGRAKQRITAVGLTEVRFLFDGWGTNGVSFPPVLEVDNGNAMPLNAALELEAQAAFTKALRNGADMTIAVGEAHAASDKITAASFALASFDQYAIFWERCSSPIASGQTWLQGLKRLDIVGEFHFRHNPGALQAYGTGVMVQSGGSGQRGYMPTCLIGQPADVNYKALLLLGDSRMQGASDTPDTVEGGIGLQRAVMWDGAKTYASLNLGRSGDSLVGWNANGAKRKQLVPLGTHAFIWYGFNDWNSNGRTSGQVIADNEALADWLKTQGIKKVCCVNQPPHTTGTFATEAGQAASGDLAIITAVNAGLTASVGHFDNVLDCHTLLQGVDTTKWGANLTADGIHPNKAGYDLVVAAAKTILTGWGF